MGYNEWIRQRTVEMLEEKAGRMRDEIRWLKQRADRLGEDHEWEIGKKRAALNSLKRRILVLGSYYPDQEW